MTEHQKSQLDKFKEAARELETDDNEQRFNAALRRVAEKPQEEKKD